MRSALLAFFILAAIVLPASAVYENENFTQIIPPLSDDHVHINTSYSQENTTYTPFPVWLVVVVGAFLSLSISLLVKPSTGNDMFAWIALLLFVAAVVMSFGIDVVTGFGVSSQMEVVAGPDDHEFIYLENHTVYTPESFIVLMIIFVGISIMNLLRVRKNLKDMQDEQNPPAAGLITMGMLEWIVTVVVAVLVVIGIMYMAAASASATSTTDTFGNAYSDQTNKTIQAGQATAQGMERAGAGILILMAVVVLVGVPLGLALARRPRW